MSHKVFVSLEANRVYTWFYDVVTDDDLNNVVADIRNSPGFEPTLDEFVDLSHAISFRVSSPTVAETGRACRGLFSATAKRIIVAPTDIGYGIARMFQVYAEHEGGRTVYVFRTRSEACSFANVDENTLPQFEPLRATHDVNSLSAPISTRLGSVTKELRAIQDLLVAEADVEPRILTDFRDALNRVRNTAWAVEQYLQAKTMETGSNTVLSILSGERVRTTYQLCKLVTADLEKREVPFKKGQLIQLRDATQELGTHIDKAVGE